MHGAFVCALRGAFKSDFWTNFAIPAGLPTFGLFGFFLAMDSMPFGIYTYRYIYTYTIHLSLQNWTNIIILLNSLEMGQIWLKMIQDKLLGSGLGVGDKSAFVKLSVNLNF